MEDIYSIIKNNPGITLGELKDSLVNNGKMDKIQLARAIKALKASGKIKDVLVRDTFIGEAKTQDEDAICGFKVWGYQIA